MTTKQQNAFRESTERIYSPHVFSVGYRQHGKLERLFAWPVMGGTGINGLNLDTCCIKSALSGAGCDAMFLGI